MAEPSSGDRSQEPTTFAEWLEYVNYDWKRDSAGELRNALLVVSALFIAIAFQAGINLPEHVFRPQGKEPIPVIQAVYLVFNTVLLSASVHILQYLTISLPFRREMVVALWSLMFTYCWSLGVSLGATKLPPYISYPIVLIPFAIYLWRWLPYFVCSKSRTNNSSVDP